MAREVELCETCGQYDWPWGGCGCDEIGATRDEVHTCGECGNDFVPTVQTVNGPTLFRCEFCTKLKRVQLARMMRVVTAEHRVFRGVGYVLGVALAGWWFWYLFVYYLGVW